MKPSLISLTHAASYGYGTTTVFEDIEMAHALDKTTLWIGVGCTDSWTDVLRSLQCWPTNGLHTGYWIGGRLVAAQIIDLMERNNLSYLHGAGHSLGASLLRRALPYITRAGFRVAGVETYGEPASGGGAPYRGVRYVCGYDPIPHLFPYKHAGELVILPSPGIPGPWDHCLSRYEKALCGI